MKLFVSEGNPHCLKVLAALEVTGVHCDVQSINHEEKVVPFLSRPSLPALLLPSGQQLFSSNAICRYFFEVNGQECNNLSNQWLEWETTVLQPVLHQALHMAVVQGKGSEVSGVLQSPLNFLDQSLSKGNMPYLTGESVSVADVVLWAALYPVLSDSSLALGEHWAVRAWFDRVAAMHSCQSAAQKVLQGKGLQAMKNYMQKQPVPQSFQCRDTQPSNSSPAEVNDEHQYNNLALQDEFS